MTAARSPCAGAVVIVEDERDSRELLQELLEDHGCRVVLAADGVDALALLRREPRVCFVLLDLYMPRLDGFGVLAAIRADPSLAKVRLCVTISAPDDAPADVPCLPKPIDMDRLFSLIDEHCAAEACGA